MTYFSLICRLMPTADTEGHLCIEKILIDSIRSSFGWEVFSSNNIMTWRNIKDIGIPR